MSVFERYATESISFTALAHYLNDLGFRSSYGGMFHGHHVEQMLGDPIYTGRYTWNRSHHGKFHRWAGGQTVPELNYEERVTKNAEADWVQSDRLFEPFVNPATWDTVQRKLRDRAKRTNAPQSAALYLSGLVYCGNCDVRMVAGPTRKPKSGKRRDGFSGERYHLMCGTYHKAARARRLSECKCLRNGVTQHALEGYIDSWLDETGKRLEHLTAAPSGTHLTDKMWERHETAWSAFEAGIGRLTRYLAEHHPEAYDAILQEQRSDPFMNSDDSVAAFVACYRANFDPACLTAEIERLDTKPCVSSV